MSYCDICNTPGMGTVVSSANFKKAVQNGFDPFKTGLTKDVMSAFGMNGAEVWKREALTGAASHTDWNVCPKCMDVLKPYFNSGSPSKACYIATACYGDYDAPEVMTFRNFRDDFLLRNIPGTLFVKFYYRFSPFWAEKLKKRQVINRMIRIVFLNSLYKLLKLFKF